jgi:hypothetical protein
MRTTFAVIGIAIVTVIGGGGCGGNEQPAGVKAVGGDVGATCTQLGAQDPQCVPGAICGQAGSTLKCQKICTEQANCASSEDCSGVVGTNLKSCRPR